MKELVDTLKRYFEQKPPNYGDAEAVLDILYWHYIEYGCPDNAKLRNQFSTLRKLVDYPPKEYDQVYDVVSDLCMEHGRLAFREGLQLGMVLAQELNSE